MSNKIALEALKSELRESAIIMANLPTEFGVACLTEAGPQRISKALTDAATALEAMEAMEPVACLVNADAGAMVWPISDIDEAETYCDEGEFPELLYPAPTVSALQARIATQAEHQAKALEGVEPIGYIAWRDGKPAWSEDCVCEDAVFPRDIEDDCTSMAIYPAATVSALQARIAELEQDAARGEPVGWQPLATAPKDGKEFIVRYPLQMNCKQLVYWNLIHGFWMTKGEALMGLGNQQAEWHPLPEDEPLPKETP